MVFFVLTKKYKMNFKKCLILLLTVRNSQFFLRKFELKLFYVHRNDFSEKILEPIKEWQPEIPFMHHKPQVKLLDTNEMNEKGM